MTEIVIDEASPLFNKDGLKYREFLSDYAKIRLNTFLLISAAPSLIKETNLLEQQVSELVRNAVIHGNKYDPQKLIKVWFSFSDAEVRFIVEDEGDGFKEIKAWNEFNRKRLDCLEVQDFKTLEKYISFRGAGASGSDGGNALFAALEYWNAGIVFNTKGNAVAVKKTFS